MIYGRPTYTPHPNKRHGPVVETLEADGTISRRYGCGCPYSEDKVKRGRRNRQRGNEIEREVCKALGISRVGQYGGPEDGGKQSEWIAVQVKSGGIYPERIDALLRKLPYRSDQLRAVVHADTPGSAGKRRMLITLDLDEFREWYGR